MITCIKLTTIYLLFIVIFIVIYLDIFLRINELYE